MDETPYTTGYDAQIQEYENGIFNLVITLARVKAGRMGPALAYADVSHFLSSLSEGLVSMTKTKNEGNTNA